MDKTSLKSFIKRYGELGDGLYKKFVIKLTTNNISRYSKISQDLFWNILDFLPIYERINIHFAELNNEYVFYPYTNDLNYIYVDFKIGNKIIEFDGTYWHSKSSFKDKKRDEYLISKGYDVLRVKEENYKENKEKVIEQCINFINNEK